MHRRQSKKLGSYLFGIDHLLSIRSDSLAFYNRLHSINKDAVRIRLGPYHCWFLFHPDLIEQVLAKRSNYLIRFEKLMNVLRQWNGESLLISEGVSWRERRRKVIPAFKQQRIPEYSKVVSKHGLMLLDRWKSEIKSQRHFECDIDAEMAAHSLEIATITLFGTPLDSDSKKISHAVHELSEIAYHESTSPFVLPDFLPLPSKRKKRVVIKTMRDAVHRLTTLRLSSHSGDLGDLLSVLIKHHNRNQKAINDDSMSLLIAGHETSGATLAWLFILLARHPAVLEKVQGEIDAVSGGSDIDYKAIANLSYLSAAINESMRLYPAAYALFCRKAKDTMSLDGGIKIKKGDLVQIMPCITHRDGRWFDDPDKFKPERFLAEPTWPRYAHIPFGAGPRICIGQSFGFMEVLLTASTLLQRLEPLDVYGQELIPSPRFSLRPKGGYSLAWKLRA